MFETLTKRLSGSFSLFRGRRELTSDNIQEGLKEVRSALLEADVHFQVARDFCTRVEERAFLLVGAGYLDNLTRRPVSLPI